MDLGFAGLIEEIERRFGSFVTNTFLVMLMIGICVWVMELLIGFIVEVETLKDSSIRIEEILGWVFHVGLVLLFLAITFGIVKYFERRLERRVAEGYGTLRKRQEEFGDLVKVFEAKVDSEAAKRFSGKPTYLVRDDDPESES